MPIRIERVHLKVETCLDILALTVSYYLFFILLIHLDSLLLVLCLSGHLSHGLADVDSVLGLLVYFVEHVCFLNVGVSHLFALHYVKIAAAHTVFLVALVKIVLLFGPLVFQIDVGILLNFYTGSAH